MPRGSPMRATVVLTATSLAIATLARAQAQAPPQPGRGRQLTLLVTSGLSGRLVDPEGHTVASLVATLRRAADRAAAAGRQVVVLDAGRTLAPYAESRFDAGRTMVSVLDAAGCQAFVPDAMDFSVTHWGMAALARQASFPIARGFDGPAADGMVRAARIELGDGLTLRVAAVVDPHYAGDLAAAGVTEAPPADPGAALAETALDGDLGLVVVHSVGHGGALASRALTWSLVEAPGPYRLVLDPDLGRDVALKSDARDGAVFLLGREMRKTQPWTFARVDLDVVRGDTGWQPTAADMHVVEVDLEATPDPDLERTVRAAIAEFRRVLSEPLPPGAPTTWEGLRTFILEALREAAGAEIGMVNRGAIRPVNPAFFESKPVTYEALGRMLSIDQRVAVVTLTGRQLLDLATASARRVDAAGQPRMDSLLFAGLTYALDGALGGDVKLRDLRVNGRPLQLDDPYTVATNSYLLAGGDEYPPLHGVSGRPLLTAEGHARELRNDIVLPRLSHAATPFPDLAHKALWRYGADRLGLAFEGVKTSHPDDYGNVSDSRVQASSSATELVEARLRADRYRAGVAWENRFRLRFGLQKAEGSSDRETDDVVALESSGVLTDTPILLGGSPYGGLSIETELRLNKDAAGNKLPRRFDETAAAGLAWSTLHWPRLRVGAQLRHSEAEPKRTLAGIVTEGQLLITPRAGRLGVDARLMAEAMHTDGAVISRLDLDVRLLVTLKGALALAPGVNVYLYKDTSLGGYARYARLSLGVTYLLQGKHQAF